MYIHRQVKTYIYTDTQVLGTHTQVLGDADDLRGLKGTLPLNSGKSAP